MKFPEARIPADSLIKLQHLARELPLLLEAYPVLAFLDPLLER